MVYWSGLSTNPTTTDHPLIMGRGCISSPLFTWSHYGAKSTKKIYIRSRKEHSSETESRDQKEDLWEENRIRKIQTAPGRHEKNSSVSIYAVCQEDETRDPRGYSENEGRIPTRQIHPRSLKSDRSPERDYFSGIQKRLGCVGCRSSSWRDSVPMGESSRVFFPSERRRSDEGSRSGAIPESEKSCREEREGNEVSLNWRQTCAALRYSPFDIPLLFLGTQTRSPSFHFAKISIIVATSIIML